MDDDVYIIRPKQTRAHHYEYTSGDIHDHLNRVNRGASYTLSQQDLMQRQMKNEEKKYIPNYMHVSSDELAIPAPMKQFQHGMRMFTNAHA